MNDDIRDIRGPILEAAGTAWQPYALAAIVMALAVAVAFGIRALIRARRKPLPPHEQALRELATSRAAIATGDAEAFSVHVSSALRRYVEDAFGVHAPRRTTPELLADLLRDEGSPIAPYRNELGDFLEMCDLAKYARCTLAAEAMSELVERAETFVRATAAPRGGTP